MGHSIRMGESSTNSRNAIPNRWQRSAQYLRRILAAYWPLLRSQFAQHDCLTAAAALTFTSLLALVPLMTVTYIGLSLVPQYGDLWVEVQNFIFRNFVPASSELVQQKLTEFAGRARGLTTAGGIGIVSVALLMLVSIEKRFQCHLAGSYPALGRAASPSVLGCIVPRPCAAVNGRLEQHLFDWSAVSQRNPCIGRLWCSVELLAGITHVHWVYRIVCRHT